MRVFVNAAPLELPPGSEARAAVLLFDPTLAAELESGAAYVTDGRGLELSLDTRLVPGSILRVVRSARRAGDSSVPGPSA